MTKRRPAVASGSAAALLASALLLCAPAAHAAEPPTISGTSFSGIATDSATLHAEVNPNGKATKYHFEYGTEPCSEEPDPCKEAPAPEEGKIGNGTTPVPVQAMLEGLTPGTAYHFRAVAISGGAGTAKGEEATFATYVLPPAFAPCPENEAFRSGQYSPPSHPSASLPDCRAYEQASPVQKDGLDAKGRVALDKASPSGDRISFASAGGMGGEGAQDLSISLATREAGNWSTQGLLPPATLGSEAGLTGWTPGFEQVFDAARHFGSFEEALFARSSADGSLEPLVGYGEGLRDNGSAYAGSSAGGSESFFESSDKLASVPTALEGKPNLYLWDQEGGRLSLADRLNDGAPPVQGAFAGPYDWIGAPASKPDTARGGASSHYYTQDEQAISADGHSVYFTEAGSGQLYERLNPAAPQSAVTTNGQGEEECTEPEDACTIHVSESEKENGQGKNGADAAGARPAAFVQATPDGQKALFTSSEKLTDDANTGPEALPPTIGRASVSDGSGKDLSFLPARAKGIALAGEYIYWADPEEGTIGRAKLNSGTGEPEAEEPQFITAAQTQIPRALGPQYVAVAGGYLYWSEDAGEAGSIEDEGKGKIGRAKIGASEAEDVEAEFITGAFHPRGVAVEGEYLYWSNAGDISGNLEEEDQTRTVGRAKLGASGAEEVKQQFIEVGAGGLERRPQGIAVDGAHIYLAMHETQNFERLERYDIDGNPASEKSVFDGQGTEVQGITLDATHLYWSRKGADAIGRVPIADFGSASTCEAIPSCELEFVKQADRPEGLAVDPDHLFWTANQGSPPNPGNDLYRYDVAAPAGHRFTDLTADSEDEDGAQVVGVLGASEDLSTVYFAANGDLDGAGPAQAGDCEGQIKASVLGFKGQCSLYVEHEGAAPQFIARLEAGQPAVQETRTDATNWIPHGENLGQAEKTSRVSADGETLLFRSQEKLSAYENEGVPELYLYRQGNGIACISCDPTGEAPVGAPDLGSINMPTTSPNSVPAALLSRNLSEAGTRAFFETPDRLVAEDTDGTEGCPIVSFHTNDSHRSCLDAYEWEAPGTGSCTESPGSGYAPQDAGCLYLLSSGKGPDASFFLDASASGDDAFFTTRSQLVGQDEDGLQDVYDARVQGGLAAQNPLPSKPPCEAEACKPAAGAPPPSASPATPSFQGPGNVHQKPHHRKQKRRHHRHRRRTHR